MGSGWALTAPYGTERANMTLSYSCGYLPGGTPGRHGPGGSYDQPWRQYRVLWPGPSAYSAMDMSRDGNSFFVAYERGAKSAYEEIHLTQVMLYV